MQGVIKSYDPTSRTGSLLTQAGAEIDLAPDALDGDPPTFRFLRQGQRVSFTLSADGNATSLTFGSEGDMLTPDSPPPQP